MGAGHLRVGDKIKQADGTTGVVANVVTVEQTQEMFNLTVSEAHTFYVGQNGWLVHNVSCPTGFKFWDQATHHGGIKVYQRGDIIDPTLKDSRGRTNLQRMQMGMAPIDPDGKSVNLHHMTQNNDSAIAEVASSFHYGNYSTIHINPNTVPSGINRKEFYNWRKSYWKEREKDF